MHNINRGLYRGCAPGGIRTPNLLIRSQMLKAAQQQLSMAGIPSVTRQYRP